jgi:hypothetical protein
MELKSKTIKLAVTEKEKLSFQQNAESKQKNESDLLRDILKPYLKTNNSAKNKEEKKLKTKTVRARLVDSEVIALNKRLNKDDISPSAFLVSIIRQELGAPRYLNRIEIKEINQSRNELRAIGRNLNQLITSINSGDNQSIAKIDEKYLKQIIIYIKNLVTPIENYLDKNFTRIMD